MPTTPVAVFDVDLDLLATLERRHGPPIDSYLMGWQVWLVPIEDDDAPPELELELRLHPPPGFTQPRGLSHHDLWDEVIAQVADGRHPFVLGEEQRSLDELWVLLEVFPAFGDPVTAAQVARWAAEQTGREPTAAGAVDHERIAGGFKRRGHDIDLPGALRAALTDDG